MSKEYEKMRYDHVRLEPADNGFVLSYTEHTPAASHDLSIYNDKIEVFTNEEIGNATNRLKELHAHNRSLK